MDIIIIINVSFKTERIKMQSSPLTNHLVRHTHILRIDFSFVFESFSILILLARLHAVQYVNVQGIIERLYSLKGFARTSSIYFRACCIEGNLLFATRFECIFVVCNDVSPPKDVENKLPSNMYKTPSL